MARPNKQKIDHENLRDWLVAHPAEAGQVLRKIEETATETMKKYLQRYFQDGESIGAIAEAEGVEPSTVSRGIAKALERAGGWLVANLPERALQRQKENETPPKEKRYLHMKESEIAEWYRQARDKELQIGILADMNVTTKAVIREVLREQGIDLPEPKKNRGRARKNVEPLPVEEDVESSGLSLPDVTEMAAESRDETEGETMAKDAEQKTMTLRTLANVLQCVNEAFPDTPAQFAAGRPSGALLTVHWGADGEIEETALLIEGA